MHGRAWSFAIRGPSPVKHAGSGTFICVVSKKRSGGGGTKRTGEKKPLQVVAAKFHKLLSLLMRFDTLCRDHQPFRLFP